MKEPEQQQQFGTECWKTIRSNRDKNSECDLLCVLFLCGVPERAGWVEALDYEDWVEEGAGTGGHLGPVLRCCRPTLGLHSNRGGGRQNNKEEKCKTV